MLPFFITFFSQEESVTFSFFIDLEYLKVVDF